MRDSPGRLRSSRAHILLFRIVGLAAAVRTPPAVAELLRFVAPGIAPSVGLRWTRMTRQMRGRRAALLLLVFKVVSLSALQQIGLQAAARLLDLRLPSTRPAVRAAYRRKAATTHPDVANDDSAFIQITNAYELVLQFGCAKDSVATQAWQGAARQASRQAAAPRPRPPQAQNTRWLQEYRQKLLLLQEMRAELWREQLQVDRMAQNVRRYTEEIDDALAAGRFTTRVLLRNQAEERYADMTRAARVLEARCDALAVEVSRLRDELEPGTASRRSAAAAAAAAAAAQQQQQQHEEQPRQAEGERESLAELEAEHRRRETQLSVMARNIQRYAQELSLETTSGTARDGTARDEGRLARFRLLHAHAKRRYAEMERELQPLTARRTSARRNGRGQTAASAGTAAETAATTATAQKAEAQKAEAQKAEAQKAEGVGEAGVKLEWEAALEAELIRRARQKAENEKAEWRTGVVTPTAGDKKAAAAAHSHGTSLPSQVNRIKDALGIDMDLAIAPALREANRVMGLPDGQGSLPSQAAAILEQLGL